MTPFPFEQKLEVFTMDKVCIGPITTWFRVVKEHSDS